MKIRRKLYTNNMIYKIVPYIVLLVVICLSVGYSAFCSKLSISKTVTQVRLKENIRITNLSLDSVSNSGVSKYNEYNKENITAGVYLPEDNSTVTYKVEVTNFGNVEMGILDITGLPNNLEYEITNYELGTKICDSTNTCKLGISKEFYIKIKYKEGGNTSTSPGYEEDYLYDLNLKFDFRQAYDITYTDITVNNYQTSVLKGDILEVNFGSNAPKKVKVLIDGIETTNYTYENGIITISDVTSNIEIRKNDPTTIAQYLTGLFKSRKTVANNTVTYSLDTTNMLMNDRLGGSAGATGGNIRYYGASPKNYIDIGDRDSSGNIILWRIIGVFKNIQTADADGTSLTKETLIKIVRSESIGKYSWDYRPENDPAYTNDYTTSTIKNLLNEAYYNSGITTHNNWSVLGSSSPIVTADFTSNGLSKEVHDKVQNVVWNLGGYNSTNGTYSHTMYKAERSSTKYDSTRKTKWTGNVGLMYPSDFGYSTDFSNTNCNRIMSSYTTSCSTTSWLYGGAKTILTLTPYTASSYYVYCFSSKLSICEPYKSENYIYPTLYLKPDVAFESGTGTSTNPYVVSYSE